ncbi:MAG: hypothetical protein KC416_03985, partial [Myxococcales bacterium]|nr:hypothetical protein [Myxococcales bacterium]
MASRTAPLLCGIILMVGGYFPLNNPDTYGHLAQGRQIFELGAVPTVDHFSFWKADPQPWHNYEWLYDYLSYALFRASGANGLLVAKLLVLFALGWVLGSLTLFLADPERRPAAARWAVVLTLLAVPAARFRFTVRPHVLGLLFAALLLWLLVYLVRRRTVWWPILIIGALHVLWVNTHGSHL